MATRRARKWKVRDWAHAMNESVKNLNNLEQIMESIGVDFLSHLTEEQIKTLKHLELYGWIEWDGSVPLFKFHQDLKDLELVELNLYNGNRSIILTPAGARLIDKWGRSHGD